MALILRILQTPNFQSGCDFSRPFQLESFYEKLCTYLNTSNHIFITTYGTHSRTLKVASQTDDAAHSGDAGISAGCAYLDPVLDAATIPSLSDVAIESTLFLDTIAAAVAPTQLSLSMASIT